MELPGPFTSATMERCKTMSSSRNRVLFAAGLATPLIAGVKLSFLSMRRSCSTKRRSARFWFFCALTLTVAVAGAPLALQEEDVFQATAAAGRVEFTSPDPIEWEALAPRRLVEFELSQAEPALLSALDR